MAAVDLDHLPDGLVILPEPKSSERQLEPRAWVESVRRPNRRHLQHRVADHLATARELGEV
ncbi:MAG: hypothetical protein ACYDAQ_00230 [Mycobacteriales bacterium]